MGDTTLLRYSRHILLDEIGIAGQERFRQAHVLVIGAGGLGCAASLYLAASGVGRLTLVDDDVVDLTNLQRQIAHTTDRVGQKKVASAAAALHAVNPLVQIQAVDLRVNADWLDQQLPNVNVVLDCTDHFAIRQTINAACVRHAKPLVSGAALRFDGQLALYDTAQPDAPCYACVFPADSDVREDACSTMGVLAPLVGMVGTAQAADALLVLLGHSGRLAGRLRTIDACSMAWSEFRVSRDPACPVCRSRSRPLDWP